MMTTHERLVYMANQIARNFAAQGVERAVLATADHIASYWDPGMKAGIFADRRGLDPIADRAITSLIERGPPPHQTAATAGHGRSDAG
ncbi:MAG: formate dehydrogenase subunit delta [Sphingomonadaceae bacterium]